jgi:hypothetical protein
MNLENFKFVGWKLEGTSDKIWAIYQLERYKHIALWGRRGKSLRAKMHSNMSQYEAQRLIQTKINEGYDSIKIEKLEAIHPDLTFNVESSLMMAVLKGE